VVVTREIKPEDTNPSMTDDVIVTVTRQVKAEDTGATVSDQADVKKNPETRDS
jgi:hypothetical protein